MTDAFWTSDATVDADWWQADAPDEDDRARALGSLAGSMIADAEQPVREMSVFSPTGAVGPAEQAMLEATIREQVPFAGNVAQGALFGFGDELAGMGRGAITAAQGGDYGVGYEQGVADARDFLAGTAQDYPLQSGAGQAAGAFAVPAWGLARLLGQGARLPQMIRAGATYGAGEGALQGLGHAEGSAAERLPGAGAGAVIGGMVGGLMPILGRLGENAIAGPLRRWGGRVAADMFPGSGGYTGQAARHLGEAMEAEGTSLPLLMGTLQAQRAPYTLAEAGGRRLQSLLGTTYLAGGPAATARIERFLTRRMLGDRPGMLGTGSSMLSQHDRIRRVISDELGDPGRFWQNADDWTRARSQGAERAYQEAYDIDPAALDTPQVREVLGRGQTMRRAFRRAQRIAEIEGRDLPDIYQQNSNGDWELTRVPSMQDLDWMQRGLRDMYNYNTRATFGRAMTDEDRSIYNLHRQFLRALGDANPEFRAAREQYAGYSALLDAQEMGRNFMRGDWELVGENYYDLPASQREAFRIGVARELDGRIMRTRDRNDAARFFDNDDIRARLRPLFDDDFQFEQFLRGINPEMRMMETDYRTLRGSPTAERMTEVARIGRADNRLAAEQPTRAGAIRAIREALADPGSDSPIDERVGEEMARLLLTTPDGDLGEVAITLFDAISAIQREAQRASQIPIALGLASSAAAAGAPEAQTQSERFMQMLTQE